LITLVFRPVHGESPVSVRGAYFRICADATLRGPDNAISASYCKGVWQLGRRQYRSFECSGPLYLRVVNSHGRQERTGPYESIKAIDGALFTQRDYLGAYALQPAAVGSVELWREIAFLPGS
jgi:hypothetical protein